MMSGIVKIQKPKGYFWANNEPFEDERLSWQARGVMGYLLCKPDAWVCRDYDLINKGPVGSTAIKSIIKELKKYGYLHRKRVSRGKNKIEWETTIYNSPSDNPYFIAKQNRLSIDAVSTVENTTVELSTVENTTVKKSPDIVITNSPITNSSKTNSPEKHHQSATEKTETQQQNDDDVSAHKENLRILGIDYLGGKNLDKQLTALWAAAVDNIPSDWGAGLIVEMIRAGEAPPEPEPEPEPEAPEFIGPPVELPKHEETTPAQELWQEIQGQLPGQKNAFSGTKAVSLDENILSVSGSPQKIELLQVRINGAIKRVARNITGRDIKVEYQETVTL